MASKYGKYICTELKPDIRLPGFRSGEQNMIGRGAAHGRRRVMEHIVWMDNEVIPGSYYAECVWFWPQAAEGMPPPPPRTPEEEAKNPVLAPHVHDFPELLSYYGTNMDDPTELGCEVEFWMEDEMYVFTKSFCVYIPAGVKHCPLRMRNLTMPLIHFTMGPGQQYT